MRGFVTRWVMGVAILALLGGGARQMARLIPPSNDPAPPLSRIESRQEKLALEPPPGLFGCIELQGVPFVEVNVTFKQEGQNTQTTLTDAEGCYQFNDVLSDKTFEVMIGPLTP